MKLNRSTNVGYRVEKHPLWYFTSSKKTNIHLNSNFVYILSRGVVLKIDIKRFQKKKKKSVYTCNYIALSNLYSAHKIKIFSRGLQL